MSTSSTFTHTLEGMEAAAGTRRAALLLHAVGDADRQWLLGQLEPDQSAAMDELLQDLALLGLPPDRPLIAHALRLADARAAGPSAEARLARAPSRRVAHMLVDEPDRLIAALMRRDWPWKDDVLVRLGATRRRRIQEAMRDASDAHARGRMLEATLVQGLLDHLEPRRVPPPAARPGWMAAIARRAAMVMKACTPWRRA